MSGLFYILNDLDIIKSIFRGKCFEARLCNIYKPSCWKAYTKPV